MNTLLDDWNGPGTIECRDVDPYRCLVSFSSAEIRDQAMTNDLLLFVFDEVRHHWDFLSSLSKRVWVKIMGLQVNLWCIENFQSISKSWGKFILVDDRTGDPKSFSIARVMLDCFQWEQIHEWISLKIEDRVIDVFVKEVGTKSYSMESHPNRDEANYVCSEGLNSMSMVGESPVEAEETTDLNVKDVEDPLINVIINGKLGYVHGIIDEREIIGGRGGVLVFECLNMKGVSDECYVKGVRGELMELDPVLIEAQISATCAEKEKRCDEAHHTQFPLIVFDNDLLKNGPSDPADVVADSGIKEIPYKATPILKWVIKIQTLTYNSYTPHRLQSLSFITLTHNTLFLTNTHKQLDAGIGKREQNLREGKEEEQKREKKGTSPAKGAVAVAVPSVRRRERDAMREKGKELLPPSLWSYTMPPCPRKPRERRDKAMDGRDGGG
ncbi:hypothetical protein PIB30_008427 [Stylosanthes scabra]|uniref:DUF4283 domain-containing protein n=1 Tax=Stylosanthes scabra TaxID=79078 RepID=A0ABU6W820_9FABA|nr:hypothetical protein [Stylosanthes scabra]